MITASIQRFYSQTEKPPRNNTDLISYETKVWNDSLKINWLKQNAIKIASVSPADTNFTDLAPLKNIFKNVTIVMLGEEAHGEGNVTSAKIRLIKFLHEQMGFDMLAFESGFYNLQKANEDVKNGMRVDTALSKSILYTWTNTKDFDPLMQYVNDSKKGNNPISFCGFDNQFADFYWSYLTKDIEKTFEGITPLSEADRKLFYSFFDVAVSYGNNFSNHNDSLLFFKDLHLYCDLTKKMKNKEDGSYWYQVFKSLEAYSKSSKIFRNSGEDKPWYLIAGTRDKQMADNLIWLIEHNPNKKFIVWAASNHLSRNLKTLKETGDTAFFAHYIPMGEYIKNKYGDKAYSMGFTAAEGTWFIKGQMPAPKAVKPANNNSIECYMQRANFNYGIINYRNLAKDNFLNQEIYSNPFGHNPKLGIWTNILDGIFFINEIIPPTFKQ